MNTPADYKYQQLGAKDVMLLKQLMIVFSKSFADAETYQSDIPSDNYIQSLLEKLNFIALVALDNNEVVGGLTAYELQKPEQECAEIYIYDLAISESHRRHGIAKQLINELKNLAKKRNTSVIFVQADQGDTPAIKLYGSLGKKTNVLHFDIKVDKNK